ncbi:MAG: endopeptidase La [Alphaproteobacteria bacterium]|nr:endopeptidase La [Alphaproteobacteria bacterium]
MTNTAIPRSHKEEAGRADAAGANISGEGDAARLAEIGKSLPDDLMIVLPVRRMVLFPGVTAPIAIGRPGSIAAAQAAAGADKPIAVVMQREAETETPQPDDLYKIGALARIEQYVVSDQGAHHIVCVGEKRVRLKEFAPGYPFLAARFEVIEESEKKSPEIDARFSTLKARALDVLKYIAGAPESLVLTIMNMESPARLADLVAYMTDLESSEKQEVLETIELKARLDRMLKFLSYRLEVLKLSHDIGKQTQETLSRQQREYILRQQLREIQKELGETDGASEEIAALKTKIESAGMPEEVLNKALRDVRRLERIPDASAEYGMLRAYLETLTELPWAAPEAKAIDIAKAREILDADHFGLEKVKRRILEFLAVRKLNPAGKSPILCLVGPPGVGKTSLGQSIARAMDRKFARLSLGGVHDEAEIRGHRMTYVGAMPGNIIETVRRAGSRDCVMMLDEVDKLGASFHGDPASALLEVLDPEQNATFRDNYLAVPFDLSKVVFIATANVLESIPGPLRDRMEVIELPGYTAEEKLEIARRYLVGRQREANGLKAAQCDLTDAALSRIIRDYTREAGVRTLERMIGAVLRHAAMKIAENGATSLTIDAGDLPAILGAPKFEDELAMRTSLPGVATGLAWTPVGGDILFIEAARSKGSGKLVLTGQLGEVMKESVQAALTLLKNRAAQFDIDPSLFDITDIHVHVPAGAIPKDGPSAGVAMFLALVSLFTGRCVKSDVAMTGEISLRGLVLPVGGVKEKVTAAARAGIKTVLLPARNRKDFEDIPESARKALSFEWLETVDDALIALCAHKERAQAG